MEQIVRRTSSKLPNYKERSLLASILHLVDTNGSVKKLTLFLPGLALLQSPRTKYSIAWLEIFRPVKRHGHTWRNSITLPKTSHKCDARQEDLQICTSGLFIVSSTTLQLHPQPPSSFSCSQKPKKWRSQQLWPTMTLGWIGVTLKNRTR
jgi:hypothetical protein